VTERPNEQTRAILHWGGENADVDYPMMMRRRQAAKDIAAQLSLIHSTGFSGWIDDDSFD